MHDRVRGQSEDDRPIAVADRSAISVELADRFDRLHQLIYIRGGITPVDAAVDELTKLLFLQLASKRIPQLDIPGHGPLATVLLPGSANVKAIKAAFKAALAVPRI